MYENKVRRTEQPKIPPTLSPKYILTICNSGIKIKKRLTIKCFIKTMSYLINRIIHKHMYSKQ